MRTTIRKTINAQRVLNELLAEWNDQQLAYSYARATGDRETASESQSALAAVSSVINGLDFKEGLDYSASQSQRTINGVTFSHWKREALQA